MWHAVRRRQGSGRPVTDPAHQVVVQVLSNARSVDENVDADLAQMPGRPDAGQHEQMRGADGARAHHHLAIHFDPMNDVPDGVVGAAAPEIVEHQPVDVGVGHDREIFSSEVGAQVGVRGALPPSVDHVHLGPGDSFGDRAVAIVGDRIAGFHCCLEPCARQWVRIGRRGDQHRPDRPAHPAVTPHRGLASAQKRQQRLIVPPGGAQRFPAVVARLDGRAGGSFR